MPGFRFFEAAGNFRAMAEGYRPRPQWPSGPGRYGGATIPIRGVQWSGARRIGGPFPGRRMEGPPAEAQRRLSRITTIARESDVRITSAEIAFSSGLVPMRISEKM